MSLMDNATDVVNITTTTPIGTALRNISASAGNSTDVFTIMETTLNYGAQAGNSTGTTAPWFEIQDNRPASNFTDDINNSVSIGFTLDAMSTIITTTGANNTVNNNLSTIATADAAKLILPSTGAALFRFGISSIIIGVNLLTIVTFSRVRSLRTVSNMLPVSLAVADLLVGVIVFVSAFNMLPAFNPFPPEACVMRLSWFLVTCSVSMFTVCLTAGERWLYIVHPYRHQRYVKTKVMGAIIALSWTLGCVFGLTAFHGYRFDHRVGCDMYYVVGPVHAVYVSVSIFLVTSVPTLVFYSLIGWLILEKLRTIVAPQPPVFILSSQHNVSARSRAAAASGSDLFATMRFKVRALKAPVVVFGAFFLSWAPHMLIYALHDFGVDIPRKVRVWMSNVGLFNSAMNFFVYLLLNGDFRRALIPTKCCCRLTTAARDRH